METVTKDMHEFTLGDYIEDTHHDGSFFFDTVLTVLKEFKNEDKNVW